MLMKMHYITWSLKLLQRWSWWWLWYSTSPVLRLFLQFNEFMMKLKPISGWSWWNIVLFYERFVTHMCSWNSVDHSGYSFGCAGSGVHSLTWRWVGWLVVVGAVGELLRSHWLENTIISTSFVLLQSTLFTHF